MKELYNLKRGILESEMRGAYLLAVGANAKMENGIHCAIMGLCSNLRVYPRSRQ